MQWRKNIRDKTKKERVPIATLATPVVSQSGWFMFVWQEWIIIKMSRELTSMVAVPGKKHLFSSFKPPYQASRQRETYFATRKILKYFGRLDYCRCRHIKFWVNYSFSKWTKQWNERNMGIRWYQGRFQRK